MANLPERVSHTKISAAPELVRAAVSPVAVGLTAGGAAIGVVDHSWVLAVVLGAIGWSGRMGAALIARTRRRRAARPKPPELDPWSVPEPWRRLVEQADSARIRFDQALASWPAGPTRDQLQLLQPVVWARVGEVGALAHRGAIADGWNGATYKPDGTRGDELKAELGRLQREKVRFAGSDRAAEAEKREAALAAELREIRRQEDAAQAIRDHLQASVSRLNATVVELVSVEMASARSAAEVGDVAGGVAGALDELSDRLSSLQLALTETTEASDAALPGSGSSSREAEPGQGTPTA